MKNPSYPLIAAVAGLLIAFAGQVQAGGASCCSSSCCNDGIAASPKVRAMHDERCKSRCAGPAEVTVTKTMRQIDVAASPKVQAMRSERTPTASASVSTEIAGYRPTGSDGITSSPKVRAQLDERPPGTVEIAPLK